MCNISDIVRLLVNGVNYFLPKNADEVICLVNDAKANNEIICVRGAAHSFPIINLLELQQSSKTGRKYKYLMLSKMNNVVITGKTVKVDAGCHLGEDPFDPTGIATWDLSLTKKLFDAKLALDDLGGISHQTVGGFLSTGSSGGSTKFSFEDDLISVDLVICGANGAEKVTYNRPADDNGDDPFFAVGLASLGVMGVIVSATFKCIDTFNITGTETTSTCGDDCQINLFGPTITDTPDAKGKLGFQDFLEQTDYTRTMWWPQHNIQRAVVWKATRMMLPLNPSEPFDRQPYHEVPWIFGSPIPATLGADVLFSAMGNWPNWLNVLNSGLDPAIIKAVNLLFKPFIFPAFMDVFVSVKPGTPNAPNPKIFSDYWYTGLPMDNQMGDKIFPVWFTELWIPIDKTVEVMNRLKDYYALDASDPCYPRAGNFCVELYAAKKSPFWLSPAYGDSHVVRIDIFWYGNNSDGDTNAPYSYYQQFWDLLKPYNFRPHWAKYFPDQTAKYVDPLHKEPDGTWHGYVQSRYPKWNDWKNLREKNDPAKIFLNDYWSAKLEI